jgi:DNA-binding transcriptional LysR family regulator
MQDVDLRDLAAFVAVARQRNFRRAAIEQRMSASSLSQRMRELEERLGVRLLNRTTRNVAPTEAGERLLQRLAPALTDVMDATLDVRNMRDVPSDDCASTDSSPRCGWCSRRWSRPFSNAIRRSGSRSWRNPH